MNNKCSFCLKEGNFPTGICDECGDKLDNHLLKENNNTTKRRYKI